MSRRGRTCTWSERHRCRRLNTGTNRARAGLLSVQPPRRPDDTATGIAGTVVTTRGVDELP